MRNASRLLRSFGAAIAIVLSGVAVAESPAVDFTAYQSLLDGYLKVMTPAGAPVETRFDYERLFLEPDRAARFERIRGQLLAVSPSGLGEEERLAWAINTYNFLVLETLTTNLYEPRLSRGKVNGVRGYVRHIHRSVQDITIDGQPFFEAPLVDIDGTRYSLQGFERKFVFARDNPDTSKRTAKTPDPRLHFALTAGARGGPSLMPRAFRPDSLDAQLDDATRNALGSFRHVRWDPAVGTLWVSQIFNRFAADFGGAEGGLAFVKRYGPGSIRSGLEEKKVERIVHYIDWEWTVNQLMAPSATESGAPTKAGDGAP